MTITKEISSFIMKLLGVSLLLFLTHYYIYFQFFNTPLYFPIWTIYCFNAVLVAIVYIIMSNKNKSPNPDNMLSLFLTLTGIKMLLIIVFLLPLFLGKSEHVMLEVFNFFIPYFLFLAFEIFSLNEFLQK